MDWVVDGKLLNSSNKGCCSYFIGVIVFFLFFEYEKKIFDVIFFDNIIV